MPRYPLMDYTALIERLPSRNQDVPPRVLDSLMKDLRGSSDQAGSSGNHRPSRQHAHAEQDAAEIRDDSGRLLHFAITPNEELRHTHPLGKGPFKNALVATRDGALKWMKEEVHSRLRRDDAVDIGQVGSAMARILRAKEEWPEVSTKRYEELNSLHQFILSRRRGAQAGLDKNEDASTRRFAGYRRQAVLDGTTSEWAALTLQRIAAREKRNPPDCAPIDDNWPQLNATRHGQRDVGISESGPNVACGKQLAPNQTGTHIPRGPPILSEEEEMPDAPKGLQQPEGQS